jgi:putative colanic acid biosynthesis acetyltransferase WcaF
MKTPNNEQVEIRTNLAAGSKSPPLAVVIRRLCWNLTWFLLFSPWPKRFGNGFRIALLRIYGAKIGRGVLVCPDVRIMKPWELEIGEGTAIGPRVEIYNFCLVKIESMVLISQDCYLCTGSHDHTNPTMPLVVKPIYIKSESWLAAGVFVHPGVVVGRGCVIGARSVVAKDTPDWMICAGNPCKSIKPRLYKEVI